LKQQEARLRQKKIIKGIKKNKKGASIKKYNFPSSGEPPLPGKGAK